MAPPGWPDALARAGERDRWEGRRATYREPGFGELGYAVVRAARNALRLAALDLARLGDVLHRDDATRPLVEYLDEQAADLSHAAQYLTHYGWADDEP